MFICFSLAKVMIRIIITSLNLPAPHLHYNFEEQEFCVLVFNWYILSKFYKKNSMQLCTDFEYNSRPHPPIHSGIMDQLLIYISLCNFLCQISYLGLLAVFIWLFKKPS